MTTEQAHFRLLYVTASMPLGSGEQFLIAEAVELARLGYDLRIVPRNPRGSVFNDDATALAGLCEARGLLSGRVLLAAAAEAARSPRRTLSALVLLTRSEDPGTFAKNLLVFPKALWLARLARTWRAQHIHAHWARTTATLALVAGRLAGVPWSLTLHSEDIAQPNLLDLKLNEASFCRFISRSGLAIARRVGVDVTRCDPHLIHVGVRLPARAKTAGGPNDPVIVLCPAYLFDIKGHRYLLEAARVLRDRGVLFSLVLAGDGPLRGSLEQSATGLGIADLVVFKGQVPHQEILEWYARGQVDIVVLPSVTLDGNLQEGIPVALMEAMAHGIPVVSTATGGIPELAGEGAGILVPERDHLALADSLERLVKDPEWRAEMGAAGRRRIEQEFDVVSTTTRLAELIEGRQ